MSTEEFSALLVLATAMSFTPGPNTTLSTALAANLGLARALRFALAVLVGWGLLLTLCALGLGALVATVPALALGIKAVGVAYLLCLAYKLSTVASLSPADESRLRLSFWQGAALQFVNIKAWMLALSIVAGWIAGRPDAALRFAWVLPTMMLFAFVSNACYALVGAALRGWLAQGARLLWFNRFMALVLVLTAVWMAKA